MGAEKQNFNEWSWKGLTFPLYLIGLYSRTSHLSRGYISSPPLPASRFCVQQQMCAGHRGAVDLYLLWYGRAKGQIWEDPLRRSQMSTSGPHSPRQGDDACWEIAHPPRTNRSGPPGLHCHVNRGLVVCSCGWWVCTFVSWAFYLWGGADDVCFDNILSFLSDGASSALLSVKSHPTAAPLVNQWGGKCNAINYWHQREFQKCLASNCLWHKHNTYGVLSYQR